MDSSPCVIVLAAGSGSRYAGERHKLVEPLGDATVLGLTIVHAIESRLPVLVVTTGALAVEASRWVARRDLVLLPEVGTAGAQALGMGASIAAGVAARPNASGWLILPGDMPLVKSASLRAVAAAIEQHPVAYAQYRGRRGHPVGFAAELYSELTQLSGDEGARRVISRYPSVGVEVDDPFVLRDIDTRADLDAMRSALAAAEPAAPR